MKAYQLIASAAAAMLTLASVSVINYNRSLPEPASEAATHESLPITDFAAIQVRPSAEELRAAALMGEESLSGVLMPSKSDPAQRKPFPAQSLTKATFQLLESQVAMPYYSFGTNFGRTSKE